MIYINKTSFILVNFLQKKKKKKKKKNLLLLHGQSLLHLPLSLKYEQECLLSRTGLIQNPFSEHSAPFYFNKIIYIYIFHLIF